MSEDNAKISGNDKSVLWFVAIVALFITSCNGLDTYKTLEKEKMRIQVQQCQKEIAKD